MNRVFKFSFLSVLIPIILEFVLLTIFGTLIYFGLNYKSDKVLIDTIPITLIFVGFVLSILTLVDLLILVDFIKKSVNSKIVLDNKNKILHISNIGVNEQYRKEQITKIVNYDSPNASTISSFIRYMKITTNDENNHLISSLVMDLNDLVHLLNIDNKIIESKRRKVFERMP